ncbi:MAG: hypothetical protein SFY81_10325 [Verrucomicrobiota bacterium]|nr:hypothetical protein [Verrucomicrobiota bacterium]
MGANRFEQRAASALGVFRPSFIKALLRGESRDVLRWHRKGHPAPAPPSIKMQVFEAYAEAYKLPVFIETGTYHGDTPFRLRDRFEEIHTIELSPELYQIAKKKLGSIPNISQHLGDSSEVLSDLLKKLTRRCFFWLDGHYSGGVTAKGKLECPLHDELTLICAHPIKDHLILVDDARHFGVKPDYPTLQELTDIAATGGYEPELHYDILCLIPKGGRRLKTELQRLKQ